MKNIMAVLTAAALLLMNCNVEAQKKNELEQWTFDAKAGFNVGGTSPLPIPAEIREIKTFSPGMQMTFALNATRWLTRKWGLGAGLKFENKGMETDARVKNYSMSVVGDDGAEMAGNWTGMDFTSCQQQFFTIPIVSKWRVGNRWDFNAGVQLNFQIKGDFSGYVSEGYLRKDGPTGDKIEFAGETTASYSFGEHLNKFMYGLQGGVNFRIWRGLGVFGDLSWGLRPAFASDFETIAFKMYPIYFNFGLSYTVVWN